MGSGVEPRMMWRACASKQECPQMRLIDGLSDQAASQADSLSAAAEWGPGNEHGRLGASWAGHAVSWGHSPYLCTGCGSDKLPGAVQAVPAAGKPSQSE